MTSPHYIPGLFQVVQVTAMDSIALLTQTQMRHMWRVGRYLLLEVSLMKP